MMTATKVGKYGTLTVTYEAQGVATLNALDALREHRDALLEAAKPLTELIELTEKVLKDVQIPPDAYSRQHGYESGRSEPRTFVKQRACCHGIVVAGQCMSCGAEL